MLGYSQHHQKRLRRICSYQEHFNWSIVGKKGRSFCCWHLPICQGWGEYLEPDYRSIPTPSEITPGQQDDDISTVSRLAVLPAGLKHSDSQSPPCTANTGDWLYLSLLHIFIWQSQDVTQQENKGQSATDCICTRSVTFSKRWQQWQLSIPVLTALEEHESCRAGKCWKIFFCPLHFNVQPRGRSVLEAAGVFAAGGIFLGAFHRLEKLSQLMIHPMQVGDRTFSFLRMMEVASS